MLVQETFATNVLLLIARKERRDRIDLSNASLLRKKVNSVL